MAGLTVAAKASLAQLIEVVPDDALGLMRVAVAQMGGQKAGELVVLLDQTLDDRRRRAEAFRALSPLFRARDDGLAFLTFPAFVLPRLWRIAASQDPRLLRDLDSLNDEDASRRALARSRLYDFAGCAVRDRPEDVWPIPVAAAEIEAREIGLGELARCCDMGVLAHRATRDLADWVGRPDEDRLVEFQLMVRDAAAMDADGVRRLLDIMAAHIEAAAHILGLAAHAAGGAGARLRHSELSVIVERVLDGFAGRARRIAAFRPGGSTDLLRRDLDWCVAVMDALDVAVQADPQGDWARRFGGSKAGVAKMMDDQLGAAGRTLAKVLPLRDAVTSGRMTRRVPRLEAAVAEADLDAALNTAGLIASLRSAASRFGCEGRRQTVLTALVTELVSHADLTLEVLSSGEAVSAGEATDAALATARAQQVADLLDRIGAEAEGRTLRRRVAALRSPPGAARAAA